MELFNQKDRSSGILPKMAVAVAQVVLMSGKSCDLEVSDANKARSDPVAYASKARGRPNYVSASRSEPDMQLKSQQQPRSPVS
mmetsp:Transcript_117152/g.250340  ORF Transcript_117152/g.250340 Transcript_117152/m.250340 type:complete len:83 (+) Transcript_117152:1353-1601(+)